MDLSFPSCSRRAARRSGDDRELAILAAAERLLGQRSLQEISIDDLTRCVGISRPAFYFYFRSKDDVLLALLDRVAAESFTVTDRLFRSDSDDPAEQWRQGINAGIRAFREHRGVLVATAYAKATNPEVRQLWSTIMMNWVHLTAKTIDAERRRVDPVEEAAVHVVERHHRVLGKQVGDLVPPIFAVVR
ncbi:TetR/AcrR family transcriptional regulator [Saccharopolyspora sp. K220]|uniref:TetR/AcrR family transcriptional regulator n=1 Tax=Saccharopolyspora soli TaxID=2926618 RepID=UPI001F5A368F|nr:TetR/AcrR family transcriptional regulator [Saccharopolyspora soli]MCI2422959.1 TetR/AcrR family transcriptional regulator [Saccharopolyspora soli]